MKVVERIEIETYIKNQGHRYTECLQNELTYYPDSPEEWEKQAIAAADWWALNSEGIRADEGAYKDKWYNIIVNVYKEGYEENDKPLVFVEKEYTIEDVEKYENLSYKQDTNSEQYVFIDAKTFSQIILNAPINTLFDFTFDQSEDEFEIVPYSWYGTKIIKIFDEYEGFFTIGHWGGEATKGFELRDYLSREEKREAIQHTLENFMEQEAVPGLKYFCVEVTEENKSYLALYNKAH